MKSLADISYDPETGVFYYAGVPHGTVNRSGYIVMRADGKVIYGHRAAWFKTHGVWPDMIDHINGTRSDNRIANLRDVSKSVNAQNRCQYPTVKHKLPVGAHLHVPSGGYKSSIRVNKRNVHLGYFATAEDASEFYLLAKQLVHKEAVNA